MAIQAKYTGSKGLVQTVKKGFASATIGTTANIVLTSTVEGESRNKNTFKIVCAAAADNDAANAAAVVKVAFTQTAAAILCTVTPDSTPAGSITTAEVVEMINTGAVSGKNIVITDSLNLRTSQSASGGGAQVLANGGEVGGAGLTGTFSGAPGAEFHVKGEGVSSDLQTNRHQVVKLTTVADSATLFQSTILLGTPTETFTLFFNRAGASAVAVPANSINVELSENGNDTDQQVATKLETVIEALGAGGNAFDSVVANGNEITVQCKTIGVAALPDMGTSGIVSEVLSSGSGSTTVLTTGVTIFNSTHDEAANLTLGNLTASQAGTLKLIQQVDAGTAQKDVTVTSHNAGNNTIFRFNAQNEYACLIWLGDKWATVSATGGVQQ